MRPRRTRYNGLRTPGAPPVPFWELEPVLRAWGRFLREEIEDEVGLPRVSPSCAGYDAPDWGTHPAGGVTHRDIERACWAATLLASRKPRAWRDLVDHYRDNVRMAGWRLDDCRHAFGQIWQEWG